MTYARIESHRKKGATILDQLTAPTVTPDVLRVRAAYWRTVADRNERNGRADQARRLRANCRCMEQQAQDMGRAPIVSIVAPARKARAKAPRMGAWQFWDLHSAAVEAIRCAVLTIEITHS